MTEFSESLFSLLLAVSLGALVGLEREMSAQKAGFSGKNLGGLRTFSMVSALGFVAGFFGERFQNAAIFLGILAAVALASFLSHGFVAFFERRFGITSELSLFASFFIGALVALHENYLAIAIAILFTGLLALKDALHRIAKKLDTTELIAILKFLILSVVILPILPKHFVDPLGFFDWRPQTIWLMVILVASIRFLGYFLGKIFGAEKSLLLSGIVGGFVSSTAVTSGISSESKKQKSVLVFFIPILLASGIMFFRVLFEIFLIAGKNVEFFRTLFFPLAAMGGISAAIGVFFLFSRRQKMNAVKNPIQIDQPLQMSSAISFGAFFLFILILSEKIPEFFPNAGLLATGAIAGLSDVDAITLAISNLVSTGEVGISRGAMVILLAVAVNTLVKIGIVGIFGSRRLFRAILVAIVAVLAVGSVVFWGEI